jgi:putative transposase
MVGARARRLQLGYARNWGISARRACALLSVSRSTLGYGSRMATKDEPITAAMRELSGQYPRFEYRRIQVFLQRRGLPMSAHRAYRIWSAEGLQVPKKRRRRRIACSRPRPVTATAENRVWASDFVFDACANGQQLKCLTVIDEYTRESLAIDVSGSIRSSRVIKVLAKLVSVHSAPKILRSDHGTEFVSKAVLKWLSEENIDTTFIEPDKSWQTGYNESFNGKFLDECLSMECFKNRIDAKMVIKVWRQHYNQVRPHSSLESLTPHEFKKRLSTQGPNEAISQ